MSAREDEANYAIASILKKRFRGMFTASAERTQVLVNTNKRPDVIVSNNTSCVIIETEWMPAHTLEGDVIEKMGQKVKNYGKPSAVIGIRIPHNFRESDALKIELSRTKELEYFLLKDDNETPFPSSGYLKGSLADIMVAIRMSMTPKQKIDKCVEAMICNITKISKVIAGLDKTVREKIVKMVGKDVNGEKQAWDMASLILLNAGIFHEELAEHSERVPAIDDSGTIGVITKTDIMHAWRKILEINYHPIFSTAINILNTIPMASAGNIINYMHDAISTIIGLRVQKSGDVYGLLYQKMLVDRDNAAAYYTVPEAATLLAALVMPPNEDLLYDKKDDITSLRIADFACGTGMLLTAAYIQIINNALNIDVENLHADVMDKVLYGYDIMPTASCITASNLAGLFPKSGFLRSNIHTLSIGPTPEGGYNLGSLDLLSELSRLVKVGKKHHGKRSENITGAAVFDKTVDYILMNPPYVRATNHGGGRACPVPPFAVFGTKPEDQIKMGNINAQLYRDTCAHGNAGLASYFIAIADRKLKGGGTMGIILPATMSSGASWKKVRTLIGNNYHNITIVMTTRRKHGDTFSSDTMMNEMMLIARKNDESLKSDGRIKLALLDRVPLTRLEAIESAKTVREIQPNRMESEMGGSSLLLGNMKIGDAVDTPINGNEWNVGRVSNIRLWQYVTSVMKGSSRVPIVKLGKIANLGKHAFDITGAKEDGTPRGPFNKIPKNDTGSYQCLWNNDNATQRSIKVQPDCSLEKKHDATEKHVRGVLDTASRTHVNLQVRYNSQRLIMAYTNEPTVGGGSWPNVILHNPAHEKALTVWLNSIFGIMTYWKVAGFQQLGRGRMSREAFMIFPVLDLNKLNKSVIEKMDKIFDDLCNKDMLTVNNLERDPARIELDKRLCAALGIYAPASRAQPRKNIKDKRLYDVAGASVSDMSWVYNAIVKEPQFVRENT